MNENTSTGNPGSNLQPPRIDGGAAQRRRHGKVDQASQDDAIVIPFPSAVPRTDVRGIEEGSWDASADDAASSARRPAGKSSPPKQRRGRNSIGVILPGLTLPKELSGYRPQDVGLVTHAAVAILAPHAQALTAIELPERVLDVCGARVNGENVNRRRVLMLTAAGHVATYFRRFSPTEPWELLGCEFDTTGGRTDVAWQHAETGQVFFDELKTHNRSISALSSDTVAQAKRQGEGGLRLYGNQFAGVRVVPFGALHLTSLIYPSRTRVLLQPTSAEPLRLATSTWGGASE